MDKGERAFKVEPNACSRRASFYAPPCTLVLCMETVTPSVTVTEGRQESENASRSSL